MNNFWCRLFGHNKLTIVCDWYHTDGEVYKCLRCKESNLQDLLDRERKRRETFPKAIITDQLPYGAIPLVKARENDAIAYVGLDYGFRTIRANQCYSYRNGRLLIPLVPKLSIQEEQDLVEKFTREFANYNEFRLLQNADGFLLTAIKWAAD
jgi:hypothetical protein